MPSLPGYGFSPLPLLDVAFTPNDLASSLNQLMLGLGFGSGYIVHGSDVGSVVARILGAKFDECKGVYFTISPAPIICFLTLLWFFQLYTPRPFSYHPPRARISPSSVLPSYPILLVPKRSPKLASRMRPFMLQDLPLQDSCLPTTPSGFSLGPYFSLDILTSLGC